MISMFRPALPALLTPLALFAATPALAQEARPQQTLAPPDGSIVLTVSTDNDAPPTWSLSRKGKMLIAPSNPAYLGSADRTASKESVRTHNSRCSPTHKKKK